MRGADSTGPEAPWGGQEPPEAFSAGGFTAEGVPPGVVSDGVISGRSKSACIVWRVYAPPTTSTQPATGERETGP
ncbi:hypothetical protein GCM10009661_39500 [Catellatospora chokoriensis]|uniref:Uncharacterized protein n=1 Tax=Catellatospora chokoriensis TaxID=310353 RepID=A0A8J3K0Z7_9ACTN|nr:hypothetical protein Cch02nite_19320 [Catellatospora chokoriensis]